jgi:predicted CopG family antitoxin
MPVIRISDELYEKLASMATGFDSPQNVIERLIENKESKKSLRLPREERDGDFAADETESKSRYIQNGRNRVSGKTLGRVKRWLFGYTGVARVFQTYLQESPSNEGVDKEFFVEHLMEQNIYEGNEGKIRSNLAAMLNDTLTQHGKIFFVRQGCYFMHDEVFSEAKRLSGRGLR